MGYRAIPKKKNGKTVHIVVSYLTAEAKDYKAYFAEYAKKQVEEQGWDIKLTEDVHHYADCVYYFPRTDMDEQNYPKVTSDVLNGIAYIDDNRVLFRTNRVYYDTNNPRVEIIISPVEYRGIFDNQDHLDSFEDRCQTCTRYKNNCSILRKAKEHRIQDEINENFICEKFIETKK